MKNLIAIVFLTVLLCSVSAQDKVDLKYKLELNKTYKVKSTNVQNTTQTYQGMQQSVQTSSAVVFSLKPLKQIDTITIAEVRFDTIITVISMPAMDINSSRSGDIKSSDAGKVLECIMNRLSNSTFLVKMENTGRISEIMNLEQTSAGILDGIDSIQGPMADMLKERAKMIVQKEALISMIESVTAYLPGKEVATGEKWESYLTMNSSGFDMLINTNYKLNTIEQNSAAIAGEMVLESGPKPMTMNGAVITPSIRGIGKTEITIDTKTGWIIKGTSKQQMTGELGINAPGASFQLPIEINSESETIALP